MNKLWWVAPVLLPTSLSGNMVRQLPTWAEFCIGNCHTESAGTSCEAVFAVEHASPDGATAFQGLRRPGGCL
jgi:hypothetical protein